MVHATNNRITTSTNKTFKVSIIQSHQRLIKARAGQYFSDHEKFGTINPTTRVDFVLLYTLPLYDAEAVRHNAGVMVAGRWFDRDTIHAQLQKSYRPITP